MPTLPKKYLRNTPSAPNNPTRWTAQQMGFPGHQPDIGDIVPGEGGYTTPNFLTFQSLISSVANAYRYTSDEALRDSYENAKAMRRDPLLMGALRARQRPTAQLTWHITPDDETNPAESEAAALVTKCIEAIPRFQKMKMQLLEAVWFGKYAVELAWEWRMYKGQQAIYVRDFIPINGDKLRYKWDGTPGVLVYPGFPGKTENTDWGLAHFLTPEERMQYVFHEHEPDDSDWTEPEMAGSIHGVGVRGRLYWFWWLKQRVFELLMNYLQRFAAGLTIFYYNASDPKAKKEAELAAKSQFSSTALLYPRWNSEKPDVNKVERLEVGTASPALLQNLVTEYFDNIMVQYILGQTLSSSAEATGLGSGVADLHGDVLAEIIKYDAVDLQETIQTNLVNVMYSYSCPGVTPGKFEFEIDSPNSQEIMQYGQQLFEWGVPLDEDQAYKVSQWSKPKPGGGIISKMGTMQPGAIGQAPQGVPVVGASAPPDQGQMQQEAPPPPDGQPQQMSRKKKSKTASRKFKAMLSRLVDKIALKQLEMHNTLANEKKAGSMLRFHRDDKGKIVGASVSA